MCIYVSLCAYNSLLIENISISERAFWASILPEQSRFCLWFVHLFVVCLFICFPKEVLFHENIPFVEEIIFYQKSFLQNNFPLFIFIKASTIIQFPHQQISLVVIIQLLFLSLQLSRCFTISWEARHPCHEELLLQRGNSQTKARRWIQKQRGQ